MPSRRKPQPPSPGSPTLTGPQAIEKLLRQQTAGKELAEKNEVTADALDAWRTTAQMIVEAAFGANSDQANDFHNSGIGFILAMHASPGEIAQYRRDEVRSKLTKLGAFMEYLGEMGDVGASATASLPGAPSANRGTSKSVFLVHGHDEGALHETARFLGQLGLDPIVLHEKANEGRTVIEKFEDHADVPFAVVLLTPDDRGGAASTPFDQQEGRARQNVILELGYFLGKLGRKNVCALYKAGTEIPSDFSGVLHVALDGDWKFKLARELKAVFQWVDLNRAV